MSNIDRFSKILSLAHSVESLAVTWLIISCHIWTLLLHYRYFVKCIQLVKNH